MAKYPVLNPGLLPIVVIVERLLSQRAIVNKHRVYDSFELFAKYCVIISISGLSRAIMLMACDIQT